MQPNPGELFLLTFIIHSIDTFAYSVRLSFIRSGQFALSTTLFNLFYLVSLVAHTLQAPLIGGLMDYSLNQGIDPLPVIRQVLFTATLGTFCGIILTPTFLKNFSKAVRELEVKASVPSMVIEALRWRNLRSFMSSITLPAKTMVHRLPYHKIPLNLLLLNVLVTGTYTVGVMSAYYATLLVDPRHRLAASASAGILNTAANIIFMLFIDPKSSIITDQALRGSRPYAEAKALVVILMCSKLMGTLIGQLLLIPIAKAIAQIYT